MSDPCLLRSQGLRPENEVLRCTSDAAADQFPRFTDAAGVVAEGGGLRWVYDDVGNDEGE